MDDGASPGISAYAGAYARKLKRLLVRQAEHRREQVFLAGVWIPERQRAEAALELKRRKRALLLLAHLGPVLLLLIMLVFWSLFAWLFLP